MIDSIDVSKRLKKSSTDISCLSKPYRNILCIGCSAKWFTDCYFRVTEYEVSSIPLYPYKDEIDYNAYDLIYVYDKKFVSSCRELFEKLSENTDLMVDGEIYKSDTVEKSIQPVKIFSENVCHKIGIFIVDNGCYKIKCDFGEEGLALYGPYVSLGPGKYTVIFKFSDFPPFELSETINVCRVWAETAGERVKTLSEYNVTSDDLAYVDEIKLEFELDKNAVMEFKVYACGTVPFAVNYKTDLYNRYDGKSFQSADCETYSQSGEDLIVAFIFDTLVKSHVNNYFDIGANFPDKYSNTYRFYQKGVKKGVCLEANPDLATDFALKREDDIVLNMGIISQKMAKSGDTLDFYVLDADGLSSFDKAQVDKYINAGSAKLLKIVNVPTISINELFEKYSDGEIDFVSMDVEGLELSILMDLDFEKYRPKVFCVETIVNDGAGNFSKDYKVEEFLKTKGYRVIADTFINTIFIDEKY